METAKTYITYAFFVLIGMSGWIMLETTHIAPPVCVVEQTLYDQAAAPIAAKVARLK